MHVLIIPSWYPENKNDIGGSFFREQALALNRAGIQVGVIYQKMVPIQKFNIKLLLSRENSFIVDENVPTFSSSKLAFLPKIPFGNSYIAEKEGMKLFKEYCNNYGMPDVIHVHSALYAGVIAQKIKLIYGVPYVITEHSSSFFRNQVNWWKKIIAHKVFDNSFFNIAVSKPYSNYLSEYFPTSKWIIVPNILNDIFSNSNEHCPKNNNLFTYLHISLLDENKNVSLILKAFSELNRTEKK
ncbi:hypothetical protein EW093_13120 [Thiospirochaeta perfilievii]|uniref:Glycosyltransferase subfamily 4-like N-terminal domain-containing protein n=1 Tax=Thiospirochaeta perfilievii TaxID=252967 RepID=A0A5C1QDF8_9SPIO|nr:glycosyltransferase [Thiospirochaeta perfilievii]QEN05611.1 hypothetical protein EW093_13120 [Thiospirochaeta perfilievii]